MKRKRAFGALAFWRYLKTPQIEVAEKPIASAKIKAELSLEMVQALEASDKVTIYSLFPYQFKDLAVTRSAVSSLSPSLPAINELFHGYAVLGKTELNSTRRNAAVKAIFDGINQNGEAFMCFKPRHGLRVKGGAKEFDFVICFECVQTLIRAGKDPGRKRFIRIVKTSQPVFDALLKDANINLSPK